MPDLWIRAGTRRYPVVIEAGSSGRLGELIREHLEADRVVAVLDRNVRTHHGAALRRGRAGAGLRAPGGTPTDMSERRLFFEFPAMRRGESAA